MSQMAINFFANFTGADDERTFEESFYKNAGKGKAGMDPPVDTCNMENVTCDPPPPKIQDVTAEDTVPVTYVGAQRRISFIPGQEGGQRRQSYLDGTSRQRSSLL